MFFRAGIKAKTMGCSTGDLRSKMCFWAVVVRGEEDVFWCGDFK